MFKDFQNLHIDFFLLMLTHTLLCFGQLGDIQLEVMFVAPDEDSEEEGSQAGEDDNGFR